MSKVTNAEIDEDFGRLSSFQVPRYSLTEAKMVKLIQVSSKFESTLRLRLNCLDYRDTQT